MEKYCMHKVYNSLLRCYTSLVIWTVSDYALCTVLACYTKAALADGGICTGMIHLVSELLILSFLPSGSNVQRECIPKKLTA